MCSGGRVGRPKHQMTPAREKVMAELEKCQDTKQRISRAEIARRCKLHSYRDVSRIICDLVTMGLLAL